MIKCPLISYGKEYCTEVDCMGKYCMLWNPNKDTCLIRLALLKYTADTPTDEKDSIETKLKVLESQVRAIGLGFPIMNFGNTVEKDWTGLQGGL